MIRIMKKIYSDILNGFVTIYDTDSGRMTWDGKVTTRTPETHPYSYDTFVTYRKYDNNEHNGTIYTDRLSGWIGYDKYRDMLSRHFGEQGDYWDTRSPKKVESFLREYTENKSLELVGILQGCNASNGYPYRVLLFNQ